MKGKRVVLRPVKLRPTERRYEPVDHPHVSRSTQHTIDEVMRGTRRATLERETWQMNDGQPSGKTRRWWSSLKRWLRMTR